MSKAKPKGKPMVVWGVVDKGGSLWIAEEKKHWAMKARARRNRNYPQYRPFRVVRFVESQRKGR